jgi:hypothetical protein
MWHFCTPKASLIATKHPNLSIKPEKEMKNRMDFKAESNFP